MGNETGNGQLRTTRRGSVSDPALAAEVRALVEREGETASLALLGCISRPTLARLVGAMPVRRVTATHVRAHLAKLAGSEAA